jgi:cell division protein FtsW
MRSRARSKRAFFSIAASLNGYSRTIPSSDNRCMDGTIYRLRHRDVLILCVLALLCFGVVMVTSASDTLSKTDAAATVARKNTVFAGLAMITFLVIGFIDYAAIVRPGRSIWKSPIVWCLGFAVVACLAVLVPGVGMQVNGARRWIKLGPIQLQPSELAKWSMVLFLAWWLSARPVDVNRFFKGFLPTVIPVGLLCLLVVIQDFGTAALIALCALTMLLCGGVRRRHILVLLIPAILVGFFFIHHAAYRQRRIMAFWDPYAAPKGDGYHMIQSLLSFSTGGVRGRGLGNGIQKLGYLPEDTTDFIFSVICEELGLFGALLTVTLYLGILYVAWQVIRQKRDDFGRLLAFGIASMIGLQAAINIAVATVSVPPKGLSLPLISAGGSGLVITCAALGLLLSVTRHEHLDEGESSDQPSRATPPRSGRIAAPSFLSPALAPEPSPRYT